MENLEYFLDQNINYFENLAEEDFREKVNNGEIEGGGYVYPSTTYVSIGDSSKTVLNGIIYYKYHNCLKSLEDCEEETEFEFELGVEDLNELDWESFAA